MKKISTKLILLLIFCGVLPMVVYGVLSLMISRRASYETMSVFIALVLLIAVIKIGYIGAKKQIVSPINELIKGTRAVSKGNLDARVNISTNDELSELGRSFNMMAEKLTDLQEDIRKKERAAVFGRIAVGLIHDLKHPINNIENAAKLIKNNYENGKVEMFERIINREFKNVTRFLNSLQNLTRPIRLDVKPLNLHGVIDEVVESFFEDAKSKDIAILKEFEKKNISVAVDRFAIERVFNNLTTNAFYAMQDGGSLTISTHLIRKNGSNTSYLAVKFIDTGIGIAPESIPTLFDDFTTSKKIGLGLGLAECKKIMEEHSGGIEVASVIQKGTTFTLKLPVA